MRSSEDGPLHPRKPRKPSTVASAKAAREHAQAAPRDAQSEGHAQAVAPARALNLRRAASEGYSLDPTAYGTGKYHPLPAAPEARALLLKLAREYKTRSGRNLFAQPSIPHALMSVNITTPQEIMQHTIDAETAREARKAGGPTRETEREQHRLDQQAASQFNQNVDDFLAHQGHRQSSTPADHLIRSAANGLAQGSQPLWGPFVGAAATIEQTALNRARGAHNTSPLRGNLGTIQSNVSDFANAAQGVNEHLADYATRGHVGFDANTLVDAFGIPLDLAQVETAAAAGDPNAKKQLAEAQRQGVKLLDDASRKNAEERAVQRGWSKDDAAKALDSDLIRMAFNAPGSGAAGLLHNAASDVGAFLSLPAGAAEGASAVAQSVTSGNPTPALDYAQRTFVDPNLQLGSGLLHNPLHTLYQHPVFAPTLASAAFKFADAALGHTPGVRYAIPGSWRDSRRVVTLPSGKTVDLGAAAHGPIQRGLQRIAEKRIEAGAPAIAKNAGKGFRVTTADAKVAAQHAIEAGHAVMNETTAQVDRLSAPLQRAARGLTRDQLTSVFWAENYGTTPAGVARAFRHYAENPKLDPARVADLNALAETFDHLEPVYRKLVSSPKGRAKVDALRAHAAEFASHGDAALRDLGIDPIDVRQQALVAHPEAVKVATADVRSMAKDHIATIRADSTLTTAEKTQQIKDARAQRKADLTAAREQAAQTLVGDQAFAYTRHAASDSRRGARLGVPASSPFNVNARSLLGGARDLKRHGTLYRTGRLSVDPYHVIEDLSQPMVARGMQRSVEAIAKTAGRKIESGGTYDPRTEVVVQTGGIKSSISAKGGTDARLATMIEKQADLLGAPLSADTLKQLYDVTFTAKHEVDPKTGLAKVDGEHYAIPIEVWNDVKNRAAARLSLNHGAAHKIMKTWRAVALNTSPATAMRNSIGAAMFGIMHGASPKSYMDAAKMMRNGTAPDWLIGRGVVGSEHGKFIDKFIGRADVTLPGTNIQVRPLKPIAVYMDFLRSWNRISEDYSRVVIAVSEAKKVARSDHGVFSNVLTRLGKSNEAYTETMRALMDRRDPRWRDLLKETNAWLGDMSKTSSLDAKLGNVVAFHRWYAHMLSLTLWTMPIHYPGRTVLLQNVADEGRKYLKEHGVWPSYLADSMIVASQVLPKLTGQEQASLIAQLTPTAGWNVLATGPQLVQTDSSGDLNPLAAASNISPPLSLLFDAVGGADPAALIQGRKSYDENGNPISGFGNGNFTTTAELLGNRALRLLPLYNAAFPQSGFADNAIAGINRVPRLERYPHTNLPITNPADMTPREGTGWEALLGRLLGLRTKPYEVSGPVADMNVTREWKRQKANAAAEKAKKRKAERAKAARETQG